MAVSINECDGENVNRLDQGLRRPPNIITKSFDIGEGIFFREENVISVFEIRTLCAMEKLRIWSENTK